MPAFASAQEYAILSAAYAADLNFSSVEIIRITPENKLLYRIDFGEKKHSPAVNSTNFSIPAIIIKYINITESRLAKC